MNAATLYAQVSRQVFMLDSETDEKTLELFLRPDSNFLKLRFLLLCRSCREICTEPYSSELCNHLICQLCFRASKFYPGCKWCRNEEGLNQDLKDKILVGLYKQLCAILLKFLSQLDVKTENSYAKEKLKRYLKEGSSLPENKSEKAVPNLDKNTSLNTGFHKSEDTKRKLRKDKASLTDLSLSRKEHCSPSCCKCKKKKSFSDFSHNPMSPGKISDEGVPNLHYFEDIRPSESYPPTVTNGNHKKHQSGLKMQDDFPEHDPLLNPKVYKSISTTILKKRKNMNIFEKFGLALSPPANEQTDYSMHKLPKKSKSTVEKSNNGLYEPKLEPLRLKVKKINSKGDDCSVHYNITKVTEKKTYATEEMPNEIASELESTRKNKRRASTFITNYAIFSDDSDFEPTSSFQKQRKMWTPKEIREVCGCGVGNVKNVTDICRRSRCPCFSQGRACLNCKCRFCSNPYSDTNKSEEVTNNTSLCEEIITKSLSDELVGHDDNMSSPYKSAPILHKDDPDVDIETIL